MKGIKIKLLFLFLFACALYGIVALSGEDLSETEKHDYSKMHFDSLRITISTNSSRREIMVYDTAFIEEFLDRANNCKIIAMEKFGSSEKYSFDFFGENNITLDLSFVPDGRVVLYDLNSFYSVDKVFDGESMKQFIDYTKSLKMKKIY